MEPEVLDLISADATDDSGMYCENYREYTNNRQASDSGRKRKRNKGWSMAESVTMLDAKGDEMRLSLDDISSELIEQAEALLSKIEGLENYYGHDSSHCLLCWMWKRLPPEDWNVRDGNVAACRICSTTKLLCMSVDRDDIVTLRAVAREFRPCVAVGDIRMFIRAREIGPQNRLPVPKGAT